MQTKSDGQSVLLTCDAESDRLLLEELKRIGLAQSPGDWLDTGDAVQGSILRVESEWDFDQFSAAIQGFVFARHVAPIDFELDLKGDESDIDTLCALAPEISARLDATLSFSVQTRILGEGKLPYRKVVLNEMLSTALEAVSGAIMDCREPQQVVSVLCSPDKAYVGVSLTEKNRSAWPGGKHRFKREDEQVSRAEFKLLEAFSVFDIELPTSGHALDIGASPGGWSRVLAAVGLQVDAVDPGDLDPRLRGNRLIRHHRCRIQEYSSGPKPFDMIVNDMKMDARESVEIMLGFAGRMAPGGLAVMTLKMPKIGHTAAEARKALNMVRLDLDRLATRFEIVGARQLYHNRSEVTVVMRSYRR